MLDNTASLPYGLGRIMSTSAVLSVLAFILGVIIATLGYRLHKARKRIKLLEGVEVRCAELTAMNELLTSGASVKLTTYERNMILMAIEYPPYRGMIQSPQTERVKRDVWRGLRQKIRESIKE